jgi:hypothetical protein
LTFNGLHGVISQKIVLFITTAVRTSNPESEKVEAKGKYYTKIIIYRK